VFLIKFLSIFFGVRKLIRIILFKNCFLDNNKLFLFLA
jgi:hypothetical protein